MVNNISKLHTELALKELEIQSLRDKLKHIPELKLSPVFEKGLVYGVCYKDGHGNLEAVDLMANQLCDLSGWAAENAKHYLDGTLYIVGFKPVKIMLEVK